MGLYVTRESPHQSNPNSSKTRRVLAEFGAVVATVLLLGPAAMDPNINGSTKILFPTPNHVLFLYIATKRLKNSTVEGQVTSKGAYTEG